MAKRPTINTIDNIDTSENLINENFNNVAEAFDNTVSRDGSTPNTMSAEFDMNSNRILNLPPPVGNNEPVTLGYLEANGIVSSPTTSFKVLNSATDTTSGFLSEKLSTSDGLTLTTLNPAGDEVLQISPTLASDSGLEETVTGIQVVDGEGIAVDNNGVALDLPSLTDITGVELDAADTFLVYDSTAMEHKEIAFSELSGLIVAPPADETTAGIAEIATDAEAIAFTDDERIITPAKLASANYQYFHIQQQYATGINDSLHSNNSSFSPRPINTVIFNNITGASLDTTGHQFVLPAGTYEISFQNKGGPVAIHTRLRALTDGVEIRGLITSNNVPSNYENNTQGHGIMVLTSASQNVQLGTRCAGVSFSAGATAANISGEPEIYVNILVRKIG